VDNNDVLRKLRFILNYRDKKTAEIFAKGQLTLSTDDIDKLLKKEDDPEFVACTDVQLAHFLNGLIVEKRGPKEGEPPVAETNLNNNVILRKLKIALDYKNEDILETLEKAGAPISKHELSAFFRRVDHKHYRECKDQFLRSFLKGLQLILRDVK